MAKPDAVIVPIVIGLTVAIILVVLFFVTRRDDLRLHRGLSMWRRRAIRKTGLRALAHIVDVQFESILGANDMVLDIECPGRANYRAEVAEVIELNLTDFALRGMTIAVFVDRNDPRAVVVDLADLERKAKQKKIDAQEKHNSLLRGG